MATAKPQQRRDGGGGGGRGGSGSARTLTVRHVTKVDDLDDAPKIRELLSFLTDQKHYELHYLANLRKDILQPGAARPALLMAWDVSGGPSQDIGDKDAVCTVLDLVEDAWAGIMNARKRARLGGALDEEGSQDSHGSQGGQQHSQQSQQSRSPMLD